MPAERYFVGEITQPFTYLDGQEFHHFLHVMRNKIGDEIELVDGKGCLALAKVVDIEKKKTQLEIIQLSQILPPKFRLILAQAIPRLNRLEFILEKGTELGMSEIWLFPGKLSEKSQFSENQQERLHTIITGAMKQCGRLFLPQIILKPPLQQWTNLPLTSFYGDLEPSAPALHQVCQGFDEGVLFFIGPESGFTTDEINKLQTLGSQGVKLHQNILRTDTAALSALSILSHLIL